MESFSIKTSNGIVVELSENDMYEIHKHYIEQSTADYLRDNHADWTEEKVQAIAIEARRQMYKYDFTEEDAITEALEEFNRRQLETQDTERPALDGNSISAGKRHRGR